jgi:hypothetical protein
MATSNNIIRPTAFLSAVARVHLSHLFRDPFAVPPNIVVQLDSSMINNSSAVSGTKIANYTKVRGNRSID